MATRGFVGMVFDDQTLRAYCHYDAYPSRLGMRALLFTRANLGWIEVFARQFFALTRVNPDQDPTSDQLAQLRNRGFEDVKNWPDLQDEARGDLGVFLQSGFLSVLSDRPVAEDRGSLDVEWGYMINLDTGNFEAYLPNGAAVAIPFDVIELCEPVELIGLPDRIQAAYDAEEGDGDDLFTAGPYQPTEQDLLSMIERGMIGLKPMDSGEKE